MALTSDDLTHIKAGVAEVVEPRFSETNQRLDQLKADFDGLSAASNRKFRTVFTDVAVIREDIDVIKQLIHYHGFRLAQLENPTLEP